MRRLVRLAGLIAIAACLPAAGASAEPFPVTNTADGGPDSLRAAIAAANARVGADSIPIETSGTIALVNALPPIADDVAIMGPGADALTVERGGGTSAFRIFEFAGADATVAGLTISGGVATRGGGILNAGGNLRLVGVVLSGNEAFAEGGDASASGGGIESGGELTIQRSTISGNTARALGDGGSSSEASGGGISLAGGTATVELSTISGNSVQASGATSLNAAGGGGIAIDRGSSFGATVDQRGLPRPADFPAISDKEGGDGSDIGAFELQVPPGGVPLPAAPILVGTEPGDRTPPQTRIVSGPARVGYERKAKFRFNSSEAQSSFKCKLDKKKWRKCRSPYRLKVKPGKHLFKVRATDRFGNADPSPARFSWRVKRVG